MEEQFGLSDLRHLITRSTTGPVQAQLQPYLPTQPQPPDFFSSHHHQLHHHHPSFDHHMLVMGRHVTTNTTTDHHHHHHMLHQQGGMSLSRDPNTTNNATTSTVAFTTSGGFEGGAARWPRQETLTLLEIRSRLDHKFKEANQKGPLWDEVARIMLEEHGYQRSGKKCREKFENLYKYYKKTKEGKAGRQDGKHYRFFRQLEALYGDHLSPSSSHHHYIDGNTPHFHPNTTTATTITNTDGDGTCGGGASVSLSSDFATSSEDDDEDVLSEGKKKRKGKQKSWKAKIRDFIDIQMRKIMEKQEAWLDKMMRAIEKRELERREREEEWKKQEMDRIEREHKFWASERAWIEARDSALLKALNKLTSGDHQLTCGGDHWAEPEITKIIQLRTAMESRFEQCGFSEEVLWEDISAKMAYFGYERSATICKDKWDSINKELQDKGNVVKKRKDNKNKISSNNDSNNYGVISNSNHHNGGGLYINNHVISGLNHGNNCEINEPRLQLNDGSSSSPSSHNSNINVNATNVMNDSCLRFFLGDGDNNLGWETNYGVKTQHG